MQVLSGVFLALLLAPSQLNVDNPAQLRPCATEDAAQPGCFWDGGDNQRGWVFRLVDAPQAGGRLVLVRWLG